jgi:hypothetical protein
MGRVMYLLVLSRLFLLTEMIENDRSSETSPHHTDSDSDGK